MVRNGRYIKDFSYLGRPIKEVIYIDFTAETAPYHKENVIVLPEFEGDISDRHLYEIIPFLKRKSNFCLLSCQLFSCVDLAKVPGDVRDEIKMYGNENTARAFNTMRA